MLTLDHHYEPSDPAAWFCPICNGRAHTSAEFDGIEPYMVSGEKRTYSLECDCCGETYNVDESSLYKDFKYEYYHFQLVYTG